MKTIKILAALIFITNATFAGGGWKSSTVRLSLNGGSSYQYVLNDEGWSMGGWEMNTLFDSHIFGTPTSFVLDGGDGDAWTDDSPGYTISSFILYYRVYKTGNSPGSWNQVALNNQTYASGNDYIFSKTNANINVLALATSGTGAYTIEVVMSKNQYYWGGNWNSMVPGGQAEIYSSATSGFKATFTVASLPVELTGFGARQTGRTIALDWTTATETNNYGFDLERKSGNTWTRVGFIEGHGTTNAPQTYSYIDNSARGKVVYRLKQIDRDGKFEYSKEVEVTAVAAPAAFTLSQNYPNPFNPTTVINYSIGSAGHVALKVYDVLGKEVAELVNSQKEAGNYTATFEALHLPSGVYFYKLDAGSFSDVKRLSVMK